MDERAKILNLSELKNGIAESEDINFSKTILGGYSPKEVSEYIKSLKDRLSHAESSFKNELEEYNSMVSMLTQERDEYIKRLKDSNLANDGLKQKIAELTEEKENLLQKNNALEESSLSQKDLETFEETFNHNEELQNRITEYDAIRQDNERYIAEISHLEGTVIEQNERIDELMKTQISQEDYDSIMLDYMFVKEKYDELMTDKSRILAEKNVLEEENLRLSENLEKSSKEKRELREANTKIELSTRDKIFELETKVYEYAQYHKKNIKEIRENVKNILELIDEED